MSGLDLFGRPSLADDGRRSELDRYFTPSWMVASLLHHQAIDRQSLILEPCCGDGAIVLALQSAGFGRIITNDLDPRHVASRHRDAAAADFWAMKTVQDVDWVISNPPFGEAQAILEHAELVARVGVAFLLRKTFLEPTRERGPWLALHPPSRIVGLPRHSFRGDGSDSVSTDWHIWLRVDRRRSSPPIVIDPEAKSRRLS